MEYWVAMNKKELQISLLLLKKTSLPGVLELRSDFSPDENDLREMVNKKFFEDGDTGTRWNPFVKTVLWSAVNAQSKLRIDQDDQILCRLYFYCETMILLVKEPKQDLYVFYFVPLLPKAIGGLAKCLENLEGIMPPSAIGDSRTLLIPSEVSEESKAISSILEYAAPDWNKSDFTPITVNGWCFSEHTIERVLMKTSGTFYITNRNGDMLILNPVGYFDFIEHISRWIVQTHGRSIASKEKENG